jgi:hypothetical protein
VRVLPYEVLLHGRHVDPVSLQDCIRVLVDSRAGMFSGQGFVPYKHDEPFVIGAHQRRAFVVTTRDADRWPFPAPEICYRRVPTQLE